MVVIQVSVSTFEYLKVCQPYQKCTVQSNTFFGHQLSPLVIPLPKSKLKKVKILSQHIQLIQAMLSLHNKYSMTSLKEPQSQFLIKEKKITGLYNLFWLSWEFLFKVEVNNYGKNGKQGEKYHQTSIFDFTSLQLRKFMCVSLTCSAASSIFSFFKNQ